MSGAPFRLAHLSDLHATRVDVRSPLEILNKRLLGWLSWKRKRHLEHRHEVLEALLADLARTAPDHLAISGDLTNLGLEREFEEAALWLRRLGSPERVSAVPGNHDVYVATSHAQSWSHWAPYLRSSPAPGSLGSLGDSRGESGPEDRVRFPTVRVRGPLALVGVCSAVATPPFRATGRVGAPQLEALEATLSRLRDRGLARVVLMHHPPIPAGLKARKALSDADALRGVLARAGAELVLHGHAHRATVGVVRGPDGNIPVLGAPSASALGRHGDERRARYNIYRIEAPAPGQPLRIEREVRVFSLESRAFKAEPEPADALSALDPIGAGG